MKHSWVLTTILILLLLHCLGCVESTPATNEEKNESTTSRPVVTAETEHEIYRSLNRRREMISSIENSSHSELGIERIQEELDMRTKDFMELYGLTQSQIEEILRKGDENSWE